MFVSSHVTCGSGIYIAITQMNSIDRIFRTKLGLSQFLMVQERAHNLNITLKGYPKKFWGLFGQKAHKTLQITLFHPQRRSLSLALMGKGQAYNP